MSGAVESYILSSTTISAGVVFTGGAHSSKVFGLIQINANQVVTASADQTIKVWNVNTSSLVNTYNGHTATIECIAVLPGGLLASGGDDMTLRVWNMQYATVSTIPMTGIVYGMMWNPIIGYLVISIPNSLLLLNTTTLTVAFTFTATSRTFYSMDLLQPSGNVLMIGSHLDVYSYPSGTRVFTYTLSQFSYAVKLLPDNVTAVVGLYNGSIALFNSNTCTPGSTVPGHSATLEMFSVTPDLVYLLSVGYDGYLILWTWSTMSLTKVNMFNSGIGTLFSASFIAGNFSSGK
jgi:WD40 repeat protein